MAPRWIAGSRALARRLLPLTMGVVVATFVASTIYSQLLLTNDVDALDIASNSAPSIADIANARAGLRALARSADRAVTAADPQIAAQARADYAQQRLAVDAALADYGKTPDYRGERELFVRVPAGLAQLDALVAAGAPGREVDRSAAQRAVEAAIDEVESSLRQVADLNLRHLRSSAETIARVGRRKNVYAFLLDGFGIVVAFIATVLATRTVERFIATLRRRARELEHMAIQVGHEIANPLTPIQVALRTFDERDGDEHERNALARARRSVHRIEESIGRLTTFARAGLSPAEPSARALVAPALHAAAAQAGLTVAADPMLEVACSDALLRALLADLLGGSAPTGGTPLAGVEVRAFRRRVRVTVLRPPDGDRAADPFDPQLHIPGSEHPGIDLRLATVRRTVEACHGSVGARNRRGVQQVWIELPRA
jgi:signal transduction histidine kinase